MKLVPEQISQLRKEVATSKQNLTGYSDYLASKDITSSDYSARALVGDSFTDQQFHMEQDHYREVLDLLVNSDYVKNRSTDKIDIGTKFVIRYADDDETKAIILTECVFGLSHLTNFISIESPIGKAVVGKKQGEAFRAEVITGKTPRDRRYINGTIEEIVTDPKEYLRFIRDTELKNRICKAAKRDRKYFIQATSKEDKDEYQKRQEITKSQKTLLITEKERLSRHASDPLVASRINRINKLLEATVTTPPTDGTIGIGTSFDIVISDGIASETRHYEMINRAVSEELEDAYVERIDTLGSKLFGLRQDDVISYRKDGKTYQVGILNVEVDESQKTQSNTSSYQYTKR